MTRYVFALALLALAPLRAQNVGAAYNPVTPQNWNSSTTAGARGTGTSADLIVDQFPGITTATVEVLITGSVTGGTATFESTLDPAAGNSSFTANQCYLLTSTGSSTSASFLAGSTTYQCPVTGVHQFSVRLSSAVVGTGKVTIYLQGANGSGNVDQVTAVLSGAIPAGGNIIGKVGIDQTTPGTTNLVYTYNGDACSNPANTRTPFQINLTTNGRIIAGTSAKKTILCSFNLVTATAQNIALVEGTGSTCGTNTLGMAGGNTAATGWNFSANGGIAIGGGIGTVFASTVNANDVCILTSSTGQISGGGVYVQQ